MYDNHTIIKKLGLSTLIMGLFSALIFYVSGVALVVFFIYTSVADATLSNFESHIASYNRGLPLLYGPAKMTMPEPDPSKDVLIKRLQNIIDRQNELYYELKKEINDDILRFKLDKNCHQHVLTKRFIKKTMCLFGKCITMKRLLSKKELRFIAMHNRLKRIKRIVLRRKS